MNPYLAGVLLGLVLLGSFLVLGAGLGASGGLARLGAYGLSCVAPTHTLESAYFGRWGESPLEYYLVAMLLGTFLGGLLSAVLGRRVELGVERGAACSPGLRLGYALAGGVFSGFAARLARGCTSGQGLSGSALLLTGSMVFLVCMFASGYATAYLVGRQWR